MINDKSFSYSFHPAVVLRTPRFPFCSNWTNESVLLCLEDAAFMEAIYLASPTLHKECLKLKEGEVKDPKSTQRIIHSLLKYLSRMSSRPTPFGLFSGISVIDWKAGDTSVKIDAENFLRHTRLDMHYLCTLAEKLTCNPFIRSQVRYQCNSSLYQLSDELRYVEYRIINGHRAHQISSVSVSIYLTALLELSKKGVCFREMTNYLENEGINEEDAHLFIQELIDAQLLVTELEPAVTGNEFIDQLLSVLKRILEDQHDDFTKKVYDVLFSVDQKLKVIDLHMSNGSSLYQDIEDYLSELDVPFEKGKLFQTDLNINAEGHLDMQIQEDLAAAVNLLNAFSHQTENSHLANFKQKFRERYEDKFMPLLEVLDMERGLGYHQDNHQNLTPLIEGLKISSAVKSHPLAAGASSGLLLKMATETIGLKGYEMTIREEDCKQLNADWSNTPPSMSIMFRTFGTKNKSLLLESCSGISAAALLGRFSHLDQKMDQLITDITTGEAAVNKEISFAEIVHLPESRTGNILQRKVYRDYEIPYLGKSAVAADCQIQVQDLMVGIRGNRIVLFSEKLNKEIIPRLSTAHNYTLRSLPVYQFLCDLQSQGLKSGFSFSWGSIAQNFQFLPRVKYKNIILSAAQWQLSQADLNVLLDSSEEMLEQQVLYFRQKWALPGYVTLVDQDNELLIDFDNLITVKSWLSLIKNRPAILLKEFLCDDGQAISTVNGESYVNQMIASVIRKTPAYTGTTLRATLNGDHIVRKFGPGSEWLYYKWYCGVKSADKILSYAIHPIVEKLKVLGYIDQWFFVRYNDPDFHLRVRFHLTDSKYLGPVMQLVNEYIGIFEQEGDIWNAQIDTYQREVERYGSKNMLLVERLFNADSETFLDFLSLTDGDEREGLRWIWGMRTIDSFLNDFYCSAEQKVEIVKSIKDAFEKELNPDKAVRAHVNRMYTENQIKIQQIMDQTNKADNPLLELIELIDTKSIQNNIIIQQLLEIKGCAEVKINDLIAHLLHMSLNRIFMSDARTHEMIIYDMLGRYYKIAKAREAQYLKQLA